MIPQKGKFYYIDYTDKDEPEGSYFGLGRCVEVYSTDELGNPITPLYEFEHPDKQGNMILSVYYANEIIMEANRP